MQPTVVLLPEVGTVSATGSEELLSIEAAFSVGKSWVFSLSGCGFGP